MTAPVTRPEPAPPLVVTSADAAVRRGGFTLACGGLDLTGGTVAVIGPNGSGKTTLLRLIAGLEHLTRGELCLEGRPVDRARTGRGRPLFVPAHRRRLSVVFQDHRLFDHLRVIDDVAFPLRRRGWDRRRARERAATLLAELGVAELAPARPGDLSGGQRQRVALARALAAEPHILLLDEPLAAVDDASRAAVRRVVARSTAALVVVVTHDPVDVATLADRLVVLDGGRVVRDGPLDEVRRAPGSRWAADFCGANVVSGEARGRQVRTTDGVEIVLPEVAAGRVHVVFGPETVTVHPRRPEGSARNVWPARVTRVDDDGTRALIELEGPPSLRAAVTTDAVHALELRPGRRVWASVKATELTVVPAEVPGDRSVHDLGDEGAVGGAGDDET